LVIASSLAVDLMSGGDPHSTLDRLTEPVVKGSSKAPDAPRLVAGEVAGEILLRVLDQAQKNPQRASLNLARSELSANLIREHRAQGAGPRDLMEIWLGWKIVAPLWAAALIFRALSFDHGSFFGYPDSLRAFLFAAERLRKKGEAFTPSVPRNRCSCPESAGRRPKNWASDSGSSTPTTGVKNFSTSRAA
jgi:hypothetical protein